MNDIELANKINASMQETHERCMKLIEDGHAKDKEIAELKANNERLREVAKDLLSSIKYEAGWEESQEFEEDRIINETPEQSLQKLKEKS